MESIVGLGSLKKRLDAIASPNAKRQYLGRLGLSAVRESKLLVARKTGNTGRTIALGIVTPESVTIEAAGAAVFLEHGTKPHVIKPRNAKVLRWGRTAADRRLTGSIRSGGDAVYATEVHHPGTRAQPFLRPGAEKAIGKAELATEVVKVWDGAA